MESWRHDLRFGLRTLRRDLGFAIVAIVTLAIGIGANAAVWSIAQAAILRTLPYEDSEQVLIIRRLDRDGTWGPLSVLEFRDIRQRQRVFESVAMALQADFNLSGDGEPERVDGAMVSADFLGALGVTPIRGRGFDTEDDREGAPRTALISHELWQRQFGGDPEVFDRGLRIDGRPHEVVGILPSGLGRELLFGEPIGDVLVPIAHYYDQLREDDRASRLGLWAVARIVDEQSIEQGLEDLDRISRELEAEFPLTNKDSSLFAEPVADHVFGNLGATIGALVGGALLVLLVACANLANLLLNRLARRRGELATRLALGADGRRVLRQLFNESLILGLLGGGLGLILAQTTLTILPRYLGGVEYLARSRLGGPVVLATMVAALVTSVAVCALPSLRALRQSLLRPADRLRIRGSTRAHRLRWGLISIEVAFAVAALVGAGLLLGTMERLNALDPGFESEGVLCLEVLLPQESFDRRAPWMGFFDGALELLASVPGVENVAVTSSRPFSDTAIRSLIAAGDRALPNPGEFDHFASFLMVSPDYFQTLGIPLEAGRGIEARDDDRASAERVMVISKSLAEQFWPGGDAVGRRLAFEFRGSPAEPEPLWRQVVGVVSDTRPQNPRRPPPPLVFVPYTQVPTWHDNGQSPSMTFLLQSSTTAPQDLFRSTRQALLELDPHQPVFNIVTLDDARRDLFGAARQVTWLLTAFAFLAAALVAVGVYGLVSYAVASSTREIGIRLALGATGKTIISAILRRCIASILVGLTLGTLLITLFLVPLVETQIYGLGAYDPGVLLTACLVLVLIALLAALVPSLRAIRITPAQALRNE